MTSNSGKKSWHFNDTKWGFWTSQKIREDACWILLKSSRHFSPNRARRLAVRVLFRSRHLTCDINNEANRIGGLSACGLAWVQARVSRCSMADVKLLTLNKRTVVRNKRCAVFGPHDGSCLRQWAVQLHNISWVHQAHGGLRALGIDGRLCRARVGERDEREERGKKRKQVRQSA